MRAPALLSTLGTVLLIDGRHRPSIALRVSVAVLALLCAGPAGAHFAERTDSLYGFVLRSQAVMIGTVLGSARLEELAHTTAPGALRLRIEEVLVGDPAAGEPILIHTQGPHQPTYTRGERVLVFCERRDGRLYSPQNRSEKVAVDGERPALVSLVRRYVALTRDPDAARRVRRLERITLALLRSPVPRLHQDAVFDLSRPGVLDAALDDRDLVALAGLGLDEQAPLVVREGIAAKLGALARAGRPAALESLRDLASGARNPVVRVAALGALATSGRPDAADVLIEALAAPDRFVRLAAAEGLRRLAAPAAVEALAASTTDADPRVRFAAVKALVQIDTASARAALRQLRDQDSPETARMRNQAAAQLRVTERGTGGAP